MGMHPYKSEYAKEVYEEAYNVFAEKWPIESKCITISTSYGVSYVRISGLENTKRLVLLQGAGTTSLMWRNIASDLVDIGYQVIAIDNIHEFGRSYYTKRITQTSELVDWLDQTLIQPNITNNIELMGFSLGAWLGAQYGLSHDSKIKRMLLVAPFMIIYWPRILEVLPRLALCALPSVSLKRHLCSWLFNNAYRKNSTTKDMVDSWVSELSLGLKCYKLPKPAKLDLINSKQIKALETKAHIMLGLLDRGMYAKKTFEALKGLNYQGQVEMLCDAGHDLLITHSNKVLDFWNHD